MISIKSLVFGVFLSVEILEVQQPGSITFVEANLQVRAVNALVFKSPRLGFLTWV